MKINFNFEEFKERWYLLKEYRDPDGNLWSKGRLVETASGDPVDPPVSYKELGDGYDIPQVIEYKIPEPPKKEFKSTGVSKEEYQALMKKVDQLQQLVNKVSTKEASLDISKLSDEIAKATKKIEGKTYYDTIIDEDDWLEDPVIFTSYGIKYWVFDDRRNGVDVKIPGGRPCEFKLAATRKERIGKVESYSAICQAREHSKKRVEWLRNHSKFGKEFFEKVNMALGADVVTTEKAIELSKKIDSWTQNQIISVCKEKKIPLGGDIRELKHLLHEAMLKEFMEDYKYKKKADLAAMKESQIFEQ